MNVIFLNLVKRFFLTNWTVISFSCDDSFVELDLKAYLYHRVQSTTCHNFRTLRALNTWKEQSPLSLRLYIYFLAEL